MTPKGTRIVHPKAGGVDLYLLPCDQEMGKPLFSCHENHPAMPEVVAGIEDEAGVIHYGYKFRGAT